MKRFTESYEVSYPKIEELEDGIYDGQLAGAVFSMNDFRYLCPFGVRQPNPVSCTVEIKDHTVIKKTF